MKKCKKLLKSFFMYRVHFLCRFCGDAIGQWHGKKLEHLPNYTQIDVKTDTASVYRINGCRQCLSGLTVGDAQEAFEADPYVSNRIQAAMKCTEVPPLPQEDLK
jgi:hypothetical protein